MSPVTFRKLETRFARRAAMGRGIGIEEAVAAAEARLELMSGEAHDEINAMLGALQHLRPAIAAGETAAMVRAWALADTLAGVASLFGMPEVGQAAKSLCQLFDAASPVQPNVDAVRVHLDAFRVFQGLGPDAVIQAAPVVLQGLDDVVSVERRRRHSPSPPAK